MLHNKGVPRRSLHETHSGLTVKRRCAHRAHACCALSNAAGYSILGEFDMRFSTGAQQCTGQAQHGAVLTTERASFTQELRPGHSTCRTYHWLLLESGNLLLHRGHRGRERSAVPPRQRQAHLRVSQHRLSGRPAAAATPAARQGLSLHTSPMPLGSHAW